ncbi:MAG: MFS transporter [Chloroflexi bacterium]|nr:MFS transporter [Chloroflexota bacterium]
MQRQATPKPGRSEGRQPRVFYGWYIVAAGSASSFISVAIFMQSMGAFIPEIRNELGWGMAAISFGFSLRTLEQGLLAPLTGYLLDRLGPRLMASIGVVLMTAGLLLFANMHSLWMFYAASAVMATGQGLGSTNSFQVAIVHWFVKKRGQASSWLAMGFGSAYVGVYPVTLLLILFGWRQAALIAALFFFVTNLLLAQLIRHRPEPYGYLPDGEKAPASSGGTRAPGGQKDEAKSFTAKDALRSPAFWLLLFAISVQGFHVSVYNINMIPHMRNVGFSAQEAALVIALYGVTQTVGRPVMGWLGDRFGRYRLLTVSHLLLAISWVPIAFLTRDSLWMVALYFLFMAPGHAAHQGTAQAVVADFFGTRRYGTIRGLMSFIGMAGNIGGPPFAGFMFDTYGNYRLAFLILAPIAALGTPALLLAGRTAVARASAAKPQATGSG